MYICTYLCMYERSYECMYVCMHVHTFVMSMPCYVELTFYIIISSISPLYIIHGLWKYYDKYSNKQSGQRAPCARRRRDYVGRASACLEIDMETEEKRKKTCFISLQWCKYMNLWNASMYKWLVLYMYL